MLLGQKRAITHTTTTQTTQKRKKSQKKKQSTTTSSLTAATAPKGGVAQEGLGASILISAAAALGEKKIYRPAAHLAPSDVQFVARDKKRGYALHSFVLKLRSPVFAAMLTTHPGALAEGSAAGAGDAEPIVLPESGADLQLLFQAMYSNDPHSVMTEANVVRLCALSHKYGATELEQAALKAARRTVAKAKLSGTKPSIPELLVLSQTIRDKTILDAIVKRGMASFCAPAAGGAPAPLPALYCPQHGYEPIPCIHGCRPPPTPTALDAAGKALLAKLNSKTLVKLISALVAAQRRPY